MRIFSIIKRLVKKIIRIFKMLLLPSKISKTFEEAESFLEVVSSDVKTSSFVEYTAEYMNNKYEIYDVDAEMFIDYYEANGWVQGKGKPIKDWKACIRTWDRNRSNTMSEREKRIEEWLKDE